MKKNSGKNINVEKSIAMITVEIIEYKSGSIISKTIINKRTGKVNVMSFDIGESLLETTIPFDAYAEIIDGKAEIIIDGTSHILNTGQSIVIPAHAASIINANERFKMIQTIIKSGYDN
ncbi:MAG: cupin domain-containing protein [Candidatus Kapaibacterium sp.]